MRVVGSLGKHVFPPGLGPGVDATFHRVLELGYAISLCFEFYYLNACRSMIFGFFLNHNIFSLQPLKGRSEDFYLLIFQNVFPGVRIDGC